MRPSPQADGSAEKIAVMLAIGDERVWIGQHPAAGAKDDQCGEPVMGRDRRGMIPAACQCPAQQTKRGPVQHHAIARNGVAPERGAKARPARRRQVSAPPVGPEGFAGRAPDRRAADAGKSGFGSGQLDRVPDVILIAKGQKPAIRRSMGQSMEKVRPVALSRPLEKPVSRTGAQGRGQGGRRNGARGRIGFHAVGRGQARSVGRRAGPFAGRGRPACGTERRRRGRGTFRPSRFHPLPCPPPPCRLPRRSAVRRKALVEEMGSGDRKTRSPEGNMTGECRIRAGRCLFASPALLHEGSGTGSFGAPRHESAQKGPCPVLRAVIGSDQPPAAPALGREACELGRQVRDPVSGCHGDDDAAFPGHLSACGGAPCPYPAGFPFTHVSSCHAESCLRAWRRKVAERFTDANFLAGSRLSRALPGRGRRCPRNERCRPRRDRRRSAPRSAPEAPCRGSRAGASPRRECRPTGSRSRGEPRR